MCHIWHNRKMDVGELIRATRHRHGLTQAQLALRAGTGRAFVSRIECGRVAPTVDTLRDLFAAMGEELVLEVRPSRYADPDADAQAAFLALEPEDRLRTALSASEFLSKLRA